MKNFYLSIFMFLSTFYSSAQTTEEIENDFRFLLTRNFILNHGSDLFDEYPLLKGEAWYSITGCICLLYIKEDTVKKVAIERLTGISTQLFNEGKPVLLTYGMDSAYSAMKKNKNVDDDNNIIYLSIADCVISEAESIASDIFNAQTIKLLAQKKE
ncbi:hypothetical protein [Flavobacterium sp. Leaf359]|uniref:hypothetical protein n=1 Tax=Flavobacterium sp. Leaf359 TaxID=1736351 RepID=UPI0012F9D01B|nr:hypothetical protein [Flavobacterium sp. Leaf359]